MLIPALICNVNQSNEQYITLIKGCISIRSQRSIDQNCSISGLKQLNIPEQKNPSVKSQLQNS